MFNLFYFRSCFCPAIYGFQWIFPKDMVGKMAVGCLVCHNKYTTITVDFMKAHRSTCKKPHKEIVKQTIGNNSEPKLRSPLQVANTRNPTLMNKINISHAKNAKLPVMYSVPTTSKLVNLAIDLDSLQFDKRRVAILNGNQSNDIARCRICKKFFVIDGIMLLKHR